MLNKDFLSPRRGVANILLIEGHFMEAAMNNLKPKSTTHIIRETFYDMALYLQAIFLLYGASDILADDIIHCLEDGYGKAIKGLKKCDGEGGKPKIRTNIAVERFLKKLEQEKI